MIADDLMDFANAFGERISALEEAQDPPRPLAAIVAAAFIAGYTEAVRHSELIKKVQN